MPDVRMPDGTVIRNVPEGITQTQLLNKLKANGYDTKKLLAVPKAAPEAKVTIMHQKPA